jgi:hypothetical protein
MTADRVHTRASALPFNDSRLPAEAMPMQFPIRFRHAAAGLLALATVGVAAAPRPAQAQWSTTYESMYLEAPYNWQFLHTYPGAAKLFNGFDFGHAILYETLWTKPNAPRGELEDKWYRILTTEILAHPPKVPLEESAIEVDYARLAPEAKAMFDWAHLLHRQIYDVWADPRYTDAERDAEVQRLISYYKTRKDLAYSSKPKSMKLMQEQPYSLAFRKNYPKFNGLIWAYHWMQVGLYEPFLETRDPAQRQKLVMGMVARFWQMLDDSPKHMPYMMPMTSAVAPKFAARYPEAAIIFDNLHSMHDVISDILANPNVPRDRKRAEIQLAAARYRDDTSYVMTVDGWKNMAQVMGVENMGGPALGYLDSIPTPTVTYGTVMTHDDRTGAHIGTPYGQVTGAMAGMAGMTGTAGEHAGHGAAPGMASMPGMPLDSGPAHGHMTPMSGMPTMKHGDSSMAGMAGMSGHDMSTMGAQGHDMAGMAMGDSSAAAMMALHMKMMSDPVIKQRIAADPELNRLMQDAMAKMPAGHAGMMGAMPGMAGMAGSARTTTPKHATTRPAARRVAPTKKPAAPMAGMPGMDHGSMPGMQMAAPAAKASPKPAATAAPAKAAPAKAAPAKAATPTRKPAADTAKKMAMPPGMKMPGR